MSDVRRNIEKAQADALAIVKDLEHVSVGISWLEGQGLCLKINSEHHLDTEIEARLRSLNVPVHIEYTHSVRLDNQ